MKSGKFISNFTQISNNAIRDNNLSLKGKGLYALIQSYITIDDFSLYKDNLKRLCMEGDKAFESTWKELKDKGYLVQYRLQDKNTKTFYYEYELLGEPNKELSSKIHKSQNRKLHNEKNHNPKKEDMDKAIPTKTYDMDDGYGGKGGQYNNTLLKNISCSSCLEETHKNLEGEIVEGAFQQKLNLEDENVKLVKSYGFKVSDAQAKLIEGLDKNRLIQATEISVAQEGKSFSYIYKVYKNVKKAPSTGIEDALSSSTNKSTKTNVKKSISNNKRKDKSIYMCKTTIEVDGKLVDTEDLSSDEFEKIIQERQKLKWA